MKRYAVVAALFVMSVIFYIDRAAISSAIGPMGRDLGFSPEAKGWIMGMFALGYALAQIPTGWLADRWGPRWALTAAVVGWSVFTVLTGAVWSLPALVAIRFLFGVAEAGALPACSKVFYNWLPARERGRANGFAFSGMRLGAAFSFVLFSWMIPSWGWRAAFYFFGAVGIAWAAAWALAFRDRPEVPPEPPPPPAAQPTFGEVFRSPRMALNMAQYFAHNFTFFISISWMKPYLEDHYRLTASQAARYAMIPLLFAAGSMWFTGILVDALYRSRARAWSRRLPAILGYALAAGGLVAVTQVRDPVHAVACFSVFTFGADMIIAPSWQYCVDIGGRISGSVSGAMNMVGNLGSFVSSIAFGHLLALTGSGNAYFWTAAALNALAILCWLAMR